MEQTPWTHLPTPTRLRAAQLEPPSSVHPCASPWQGLTLPPCSLDYSLEPSKEQSTISDPISKTRGNTTLDQLVIDYLQRRTLIANMKTSLEVAQIHEACRSTGDKRVEEVMIGTSDSLTRPKGWVILNHDQGMVIELRATPHTHRSLQIRRLLHKAIAFFDRNKSITRPDLNKLSATQPLYRVAIAIKGSQPLSMGARLSLLPKLLAVGSSLPLAVMVGTQSAYLGQAQNSVFLWASGGMATSFVLAMLTWKTILRRLDFSLCQWQLKHMNKGSNTSSNISDGSR